MWFVINVDDRPTFFTVVVLVKKCRSFCWRKCGFSKSEKPCRIDRMMKISILRGLVINADDRPAFFTVVVLVKKWRSFCWKEMWFFTGGKPCRIDRMMKISILRGLSSTLMTDLHFFQWSYWSKIAGFSVEIKNVGLYVDWKILIFPIFIWSSLCL